MENPRMPLFWRLFAFNASILVLIAVLLIVSPVTISSPIHLTEAALVWAGLIVTLAANFVLLRRALVPLDRLAERMEIVDLLRPGQRLPARSGVVGRVIHSFNRMLDRLEAERQLTARRALAAQEMERIGIARDLHDEVGQLLTASCCNSIRSPRMFQRVARRSARRNRLFAKPSKRSVVSRPSYGLRCSSTSA